MHNKAHMPFPTLRGIANGVYPSDIDSRIRDDGNGEDIIHLFHDSGVLPTDPKTLQKIGDVYVTPKVMFSYNDGCLVVVRRSDKRDFNFRLSSGNRYIHFPGNNQSFTYLKNRILYAESTFPVSSQIQTGFQGTFGSVLAPVIEGMRMDTERVQANLYAEIERQRIDMERARIGIFEEMERQMNEETMQARQRMEQNQAALRAEMERRMHDQEASTVALVGRVNANATALARSIEESTTQLVRTAQVNTIQLVEQQTAGAKRSAMLYTAVCGCIMCVGLAFVFIAAVALAGMMMVYTDRRATNNAMQIEEIKAITTGLVQQTSTNGLTQQTHFMDHELMVMFRELVTKQLTKPEAVNSPTITCTTPEDPVPTVKKAENKETDNTGWWNVVSNLMCLWCVIFLSSVAFLAFCDGRFPTNVWVNVMGTCCAIFLLSKAWTEYF